LNKGPTNCFDIWNDKSLLLTDVVTIAGIEKLGGLVEG